VLGDLEAVDDTAHREADAVRSAQAARLDAGDDGREACLGGGEQVLALAGPLGREQRVAADDEALTRIVRAADLGQGALVEEAELVSAFK
jgi:hypothetical protein